jgi:hypothetical protein
VTVGLDVVTVGIEHEGSVVVRVIMRPKAGSAMVRAACRQRSLMECVDGDAIGELCVNLGDDG